MVELFSKFKLSDIVTKKTLCGFTPHKVNLSENTGGTYVYGQNIKRQYPYKVSLDNKYLHLASEEKPMIAYTSSVGEIGVITEDFYRSGNNGAFQGLFPIKYQYNIKQALFLLTVLRKYFDEFGYSTSMKNILDIQIELPVGVIDKETYTVDDIDWNYMQERIAELEQERIAELEQYLFVTGLNDYELTDEDIKTLSLSDFGNYKKSDSEGNIRVCYADFKVIDVFTVKNSKNILKSHVDFTVPKHPYVTAQEGDNSVMGYVNHAENMLDKGNCIFIGGKTLVITYQKEDFFSNDSHNLLLYAKEDLSERAYEYLVSALYKALKPLYSWNGSISSKKIQKDVFSLPIQSDADGNPIIDTNCKYHHKGYIPHWGFMEKYIVAIEKIVIADVVKFKDEMIEKTKTVVT